MSCPTSMVPGLDDSSKVKDKALAMKVNQLLNSKQPKKKQK
jgi:hypothetical protein